MGNDDWDYAEAQEKAGMAFEKLEEERDAALARAERAEAALIEWKDVVCWTDDNEKTMIDWFAGGADPDGEFSRLGLRRIKPDGSQVVRMFVAFGPWQDDQIKEAP